MEKNRKPSSLFVTRVVVIILLLAVGTLYWQNRYLKAVLVKLSSHAHQVYPYLPKVDRYFDFTVDFYGLQVSGNTRTDYELYFTGAVEKPELYFLRDLVSRINRPDTVFVDVGACKGNHSLFMSRYVEKVIAFEPYHLVGDRLRSAIEQNQIGNIILRPYGLGSKNARVPFFSPKNENHNTGSFSADFTPDNEYFGDLEIRIGDEELRRLEVDRVDIVKVDVEGYEKEVLVGLQEAVTRDRPIVMMELLRDLPAGVGFKTLKEVESSFPKDYRLLQFSDYEYYSGRYRLDDLDFDQRIIYTESTRMKRPRNVIAYPQEKEHLVPRSNLDREYLIPDPARTQTFENQAPKRLAETKDFQPAT